MKNTKASEQTKEVQNTKLRVKPLNGAMTVDVVACSSVVPKVELQRGLNKLKELGFEYQLASNVFNKCFAYAGSVEERALAFYQAAKTDSQVVWAVRGGYGAAQLLNQLQQLTIKFGKPEKKMLIGYSDVTALYQFVQEQWGWEILHASMVSSNDFHNMNDSDQTSLLDFINKRDTRARWHAQALTCISNLSDDSDRIISGQLFGGNLAVICSLIGSPWQLDFSEKILFLEEIGESWSKIDRMLMQLHLSGSLVQCKAIVLGEFVNCRDSSPQGLQAEGSSSLVELRSPLSEEQGLKLVFSQFSKMTTLPVFSGLPVGHIAQNAPLPLLAHYELSVRQGLVFKHW
jgi:muramoyltetrapeptide carboxypeptidase